MRRFLERLRTRLTRDGIIHRNDETTVIQRNNRVGGRVVAGDLVGGNMVTSGPRGTQILSGTYVGGDLKISIDGMTVNDLDGIDVKGKVIINGEDVTEEFRNQARKASK